MIQYLSFVLCLHLLAESLLHAEQLLLLLLQVDSSRHTVLSYHNVATGSLSSS